MVLVRSSRDRIAMVDEGRVCSVAWQRQHVHHQQYSTRAGIKLAAQAGEALPVVELRPFTKRVWRREKSLPNFSERPILKEDLGTDSSRNGGIPPSPCINQYVRELREQRKTVEPRHGMDRHRLKLHPKADFSFDGNTLAEHKQDLIPTFVSRQERSKTTGEESCGSAGAVPSGSAAAAVGVSSSVDEDTTDRPNGQEAVAMLARDSSNLMTAYTRDKPLQHQNVCLMGDKMPMTQLGRRNLTYLNPFSLYRHKQAWNDIRLENSPTGLSPRQKVAVSFLARDGGALAAPSTNYLPSQALVLSGSLLYNPDRTTQPPHKVRHTNPHKFHQKLGAAQDAFVMLSKSGAPTVVEQSLSFDQEVRLERCRRERSFAAVSELNFSPPTQYLPYDSQPTLGEASLMKAREANTSRDRRRVVHRKNGLDKPLTSLPSFTQNNNSMQRRVFADSQNSAEGPRDDTTRLAETSGSLSQSLTTPAFPQLSRDSETQDSNVRQVHTQLLHDNLAELEGDVESLVESTDEFQRPLSDTAATETVHVRNEQTPMSADNRARLLPRYDAYLEVIKTGREYMPQRHNTENVVGGTGPSGDTAVRNDTPLVAETEAGVDSMNADANKSLSKDSNSFVLPSLHSSNGQWKTDSQGNEEGRKRVESAGSPAKVSRSSSRSDSVTTSTELTNNQIGSSGQVNVNSPLPQQTSGHRPGSTHKPQLLSVNSSISSSENVVTALDPDEQFLAASGSFAGENLTEERKAFAGENLTGERKAKGSDLNDSQKIHSARHLSTNNSATSRTISDTSSAVLDTSSAVLDTSTAVLDTSSAVLDTSSAVLDTSNTVVGVPSNVPNTSNTKSDTSSRATDGSRAVFSAPSKILYTPSAMSDLSCTTPDGSNTMLDGSSTVLDGSSVIFDASSTALDIRSNTEEKLSERRVSAQEEPLDGSLNGKSMSDDETAAFFLSMDKIKINKTRNPNQSETDMHQNSLADQNSDINAMKIGILKPDQTTSENVTPRDNDDGKVSPSIKNAEEERNTQATTSSVDALSTASGSKNTEEPVNNDRVRNSHVKSDVRDGVENMVTVTMETAECEDSFDASKVFLTTANVDSDDWQNIVTS